MGQTSYTWNGTSQTGGNAAAWLTDTNWTPSGPPGSSTATNNTDTAIFAGTNYTNVGIDLGSGIPTYSLGAISVTGPNGLVIGNSSGSTNLGTRNLVLNGATVGTTANTLLSATGGNITIQANVGSGVSTSPLGLQLGISNGIISASSGRTITISSNISQPTGTGRGFTFSGGGTLVLSGTNTYTGTTTISAGTVSITNGTNLGSGAINVTAASALTTTGTSATLSNNFNFSNFTGRFTFLTANNSSTVLNGTISGGAANTVPSSTGGTEFFFQGGASGQNTGALTLNGNNTGWQGTINVQRGPLILGNANAAGSTVIRLDSNDAANGALQLAGNFTINNSIYLQSGAAQNIGVGTGLTAGLARAISSNGALGFTKVGAGTLVLSGNNTYGGTTVISAGTLQVGAGGTSGTFGVGTVTNNSALSFNRTDTLTVANQISGTGTLTQNGSGTISLTNSANNYTGLTAINSGTLRTVVSAANGSYTVNSGGTFAISYGNSTSTFNLSSLTVSSGNLNFELNQATNPSSALLNVTSLTANSGTINIFNAGGSLQTGLLTLIQYGGTPITSGFSLGTLPNARTAANLDYSTAGQINLNVTGVDSIRWNGNLSNVWDAGTAVNQGGTNNFKTVSTGSATNFFTSDSVIFDDSASNFNVSLSGVLQPGSVNVNNSTTQYTFGGTGSITGAGGLTKNGSATLTIATDNTFSGATTINDGVLQIGNGGTTGSLTSNIANNSSLIFNRSNAISYSGILRGTGNLTQNGTGTLALGATNTYTGKTFVNAGTLQITADANLGVAPTTSVSDQLTLSGGGTLQAASSFTMSANRGIALGSGGGAIDTQTNTVTLASAISGSSSLTKIGSGNLTLNGSNTFSGGLNLNGGTLTINNSSALGTGKLTVGNGAGSGATGSLTAAMLGVNNTAATTLANNIALATPGTATTYSIVKGAASASTGTVLDFTGVISGGNSNTTLFFNSDTSGDSTTIYRLSGNNTFTVGTININRGVLSVNHVNGLGAGTNVVRLDSNPNSAIGNLSFEVSGTFANPVSITSAAIYPIGVSGMNTVTLTSPISSGLAFSKVGTGTLITTATNSFAAGVQVNGGTFQIGNGGTSGTLGGTARVALASGTTLAFHRSDSATIANTITGSGALTQSGTGTTILTGNNTYTGATTVNAGKLLVNGNQSTATGTTTVNAGGTLGGTGTLGGNLSLREGSILSTGSTGIGTLTSNGVAFTATTQTIEWDIDVDLSGTSSDVLAAGTINLTGVASDSGLIKLVLNGLNPTSFTQKTYTFATGSVTDFDPSKFSVLANGFTISNFSLSGTGGISITFDASPVPEPGTVLLICAGAAGFVGSIRRRKKEILAA